MNRQELIKKYLDFFKKHGHKEIPNSSLIPQNDPTVLFTTAGMHPLVPYLLGNSHPEGKRLVGIQRCIRTGDIEEVGDASHHTFFEMLGNWSLGDYWKEDAIKYSYEFLTKELKIPLNKLSVTCFGGEEGIPKDEESAQVWKKLGMKKIKFLGKKDNWWGPAGITGPCGPDTEMFYDSLEIWNDVFMEYNKDKSGKYSPLKQKNVDTGMGLERTLTVLNNLDDNYLTDVWKPVIEKIELVSDEKYGSSDEITKAMRIVADHIKAAVFIINDGVTPSNTEQGYVLRRLIRRAIRYGRILDMEKFVTEIADAVYPIYKDYNLNAEKITIELASEEERFLKTLEAGLRVFERLVTDKREISGSDAFLLYQSYGFPIEMTVELAREKKIEVDMKAYEVALNKHQELSRTATAGKFKSGLADHSVETTRLHTATHLLLAAMNKTLPKPKNQNEILQRGSNITAERARFDFTYERKLTDEEVKKIEDLVNSWIKTGADVQRKEMNLEQAKKSGAMGIFEDKYKKEDVISVYSIDHGKISHELCTGPHVKSLKELQGFKFKISEQSSVGAGVRRVKVTLEKN